jgi:predicted outer membrane protein
MAQWLLVDNQGEIALAKFAQEKSQNEEVKEFAKMMLQDHTDFIESLRDAAGDLNPPAGGRGQAGQDRPQRQAGQAQPGQPQPGQPQAQPGQPGQPQQGQAQQARPQQGQAAGQQAGGMGFDIVRIKHEIGQQCVESLKEKLSEKKGEEFDKCYMGHQVVAHMQMLDTLKVFKRHASGEMAQLINNGIQTTEDHLMHAENIMKKLEGGAAATTARRPGGDRERD